MILLDFGAATAYKKSFCEDYKKVIIAGIEENQDDILLYSKWLGFLTGEENEILKDAHCS